MKHTREWIKQLVEAYENAGAYGIMLIKIPDFDSARRLQPAKFCLQIKDMSREAIDAKVDDFMQRLQSPTLGDEKTAYANWYFVEYTDNTKNLDKLKTTVGDEDFRGRAKHTLYFDMDMKDNLDKELFNKMTPEDKRNWVLGNTEALTALKSLDPMYISFTGNGLHVGFRMNTHIASTKFKAVVRSYGAAYRKVASKLKKLTGWTFDPKCSNLARIDRLFGTYNIKTNDPRHDTECTLLYINVNPSDKFLTRFSEEVTSHEIHEYIQKGALTNSKYSVMYTLKNSSPMAHKYLKDRLTFKKLFEHFDILDQLQYPELEKDFSGFASCFSPFRSPIFGIGKEVETKPSFRFDETTKKFWDFGVVPGTDFPMGDVAGLAYALNEFKNNRTWPTTIPPDAAIEFAMSLVGDKTVSDLSKEAVTFQTDENGHILVDFNTVAKILFNTLCREYTFVYNLQQKIMFFREVDPTGNNEDKVNSRELDERLYAFPHEATKFGGKERGTIARMLLAEAGIVDPPGKLVDASKAVVDILSDQTSVKITNCGKWAYYDVDPLREYKIPVWDVGQAVFSFTDGYYYVVSTGEVLEEYTGFSYATGVSFQAVANVKEKVSPYFDKLCTSLFGPMGSPERNSFDFILGQMWKPAGGETRALVVKGNGKNGKSTMDKVLQAILPNGIYYSAKMEALTDSSYANMASRMNFIGKHLIIVPDVNEHNLDLGLKPLITGDDGIQAKFLFKNPITFRNTATFIFMTNSFPLVREDMSAFLRRLIIIETSATISPSEAIPRLHEKIIKNEREAVWSYILRCINITRDKYDFCFPEQEDWAKKITLPTKVNMLQQLPTGEFTLMLKPKAGSVVDLRELRHAYNDFLVRHEGSKSSTMKVFAQRIATTIESDNEIFGDKWPEEFRTQKMPQDFVIVYRNAQAEYLVNLEFSPLDVYALDTSRVNISLKQMFSAIGGTHKALKFSSTRYPNANTSAIMSSLLDWYNQVTENGKIGEMIELKDASSKKVVKQDNKKPSKTEPLGIAF